MFPSWALWWLSGRQVRHLAFRSFPITFYWSFWECHASPFYRLWVIPDLPERGVSIKCLSLVQVSGIIVVWILSKCCVIAVNLFKKNSYAKWWIIIDFTFLFSESNNSCVDAHLCWMIIEETLVMHPQKSDTINIQQNTVGCNNLIHIVSLLNQGKCRHYPAYNFCLRKSLCVTVIVIIQAVLLNYTPDTSMSEDPQALQESEQLHSQIDSNTFI